MADINLLQSNHPTKAPEGGAVPNSLNYIGAAILGIVVILSAGAWYVSAHAASQDLVVTEQIQQVKDQVIALPNYSTFVNAQNSVAGLNFLLQNHLDWSQPPAKIAAITYKTVAYTHITLNQDGTATLEGTVPSYADLDKFLQALNNKTLSPSVVSATLASVANGSSNSAAAGGAGTTATQTASSLTFSVNVSFDKSIWGTSATAAASAPANQ